MAISKSNFAPRGYQVQQTKYLEVSDGLRPPLDAIPAEYLPVIEEDRYHELFFVIEAGQFVAFDQTSLNGGAVDNENWLVPANGGAAQTVTYATDDISLVVDIDAIDAGAEALVTAAGAATKTIAANFPCGIAPQPYFSRAYLKAFHNVQPQDRVTFVARHLVEIPLRYDTGAVGVPAGQSQATLLSGHLVMPGPLGWAVYFNPATDSIDQVAGRCVQVKTIAVVDALDKVQTVPGFNLPGTGTSGRQLHEDHFLLGTATNVTRKARINLMLL